MIANSQVQSCKGRVRSEFANSLDVEGLATDTEFVRELCRWAKLTPSALAKTAGLTPTTITRSYRGTATTRLSVPTIEKLKRAFPKYPGFSVSPDRLEDRHDDDMVLIERLPTFAGMGGGGTGEGDRGAIAFSRNLVESILRAQPADLLAIEAEGNSMEPDYLGGDQILIDKRRRSLASPGAFCLWDGDGYVVKYLERVQGSDPQRVRVISRNHDLYPPYERLVEEIDIQGRVVWFGRQVR